MGAVRCRVTQVVESQPGRHGANEAARQHVDGGGCAGWAQMVNGPPEPVQRDGLHARADGERFGAVASHALPSRDHTTLNGKFGAHRRRWLVLRMGGRCPGAPTGVVS